jgi:hypothetical protein
MSRSEADYGDREINVDELLNQRVATSTNKTNKELPRPTETFSTVNDEYPPGIPLTVLAPSIVAAHPT